MTGIGVQSPEAPSILTDGISGSLLRVSVMSFSSFRYVLQQKKNPIRIPPDANKGAAKKHKVHK